jgi:hypothetical protein
MKWDRMPVVGWGLVLVGLAMWALTLAMLPGRVATYGESVNTWKLSRSLQADVIRRGGGPVILEAPPRSPSEVMFAGLIAGAVPAGFGMLLLAIRRPMPRPTHNQAEHQKSREAITPPPVIAESPYPKATAWKRPPWEQS